MPEHDDALEFPRRKLIQAATAAAIVSWAGLMNGKSAAGQSPQPVAPTETFATGRLTEFQIGCSTFPYRRFPLDRCLSGIARAGFRYLGWGTSYLDELGQKRPLLDIEASPEAAKELATKCREQGLEPYLMMSAVLIEDPDAVRRLTQRFKQAAAAGIRQVITFGENLGPKRPTCIERLKQLGPIAADHGVLLAFKQYGVETGSGKACADLIREVDHPSVVVNYDAGKVQQQLNIDPTLDLKSCSGEVRSFSIRDHRYAPRDEDCGPGLGTIDHYKLLGLVAQTGRRIPICVETVLAPLLPLPPKPEDVDVLATRARLYLELVVSGLTQLATAPQTALRPIAERDHERETK